MAPVTTHPATSTAPDDIKVPVGEFGFRVEVPGHSVGWFRECSGIAVEYEVLEHREGGNNEYVHLLRGRRRHRNLVLSRGVTDEDALLRWLYDVRDGLPPTLTVTMLRQDTTPLRTFAFQGAFPIRWTGPTITAGSSDPATESLEIGHQGLVP